MKKRFYVHVIFIIILATIGSAVISLLVPVWPSIVLGFLWGCTVGWFGMRHYYGSR